MPANKSLILLSVPINRGWKIRKSSKHMPGEASLSSQGFHAHMAFFSSDDCPRIIFYINEPMISFRIKVTLCSFWN